MTGPRPDPAELRATPLFADLDDGQLAWLVTVGEHRTVEDGTVLFREGEQAVALQVLLDGELRITHVVDGRDEVLTRHSTRTGGDADEHGDKPLAAHGFTGETPLLSGTQHTATATAVGRTRLVSYPREAVLEMIVRCPQVCRVLLPVLAWRMRASAAEAGQRATVTALGTLAAGLAHELNNPAAAVVRAADALALALGDLREATVRFAGGASPADVAVVDAAVAELLGRAPHPGGHDALAASDAEGDIDDWLADHGCDDVELAVPLVERGLDAGWLDALAARLPASGLPAALDQVATVVAARGLVADVSDAGRRISGIVASAKEYAHLDGASEVDLDLQRGLEATLAVLRPALAGVAVHRDYEADLPPVTGHPAELNQVWTNLLGNAADALRGGGELWVRTRRDGDCALVEIVDSGPGIPPENQSRIFDPFFTTKDVGSGTGLGLHLSHRIVTQLHRGALSVRSRPGRTRFRVRLPLAPGAGCAPEDTDDRPDHQERP